MDPAYTQGINQAIERMEAKENDSSVDSYLLPSI